MVSLRKMLMCVMVVITVILVSSVESRQPVLHRVGGGKYTWSPNSNFTEWLSHEQIYVGDWLYFGFNKSIHNVLEVNKTSYEECNDRNFITNITKGGRDVFNLTEPKTFYFLCGRGYCLQGMKLAVLVQNTPAVPLATPPMTLTNTNTSPPPNSCFGHIFLLVSLLLLSCCCFGNLM